MNKSLMGDIVGLGQKVFTIRDLRAASGRGPSVISQGLSYLARQNLTLQISRGLWALGPTLPGQYEILPWLLPKQRLYVSFISALHLHGIIEQIPQVVTLATVAHSKELKTTVGNFVLHRIEPGLFAGFNWHRSGNFLIAEPEKALVDCLYLSAYKKRQYSYFPEMNFSHNFSFKKVEHWLTLVKSKSAAAHIRARLVQLRK